MSKDKTVYKILSGYTKIIIGNDIFFVYGPTAAIKYLAEEFHEEFISKHEYEDLMSDEELYDWLVRNRFWSIENDEKLKDFKGNIEKLQVQLFDSYFKSNEKKEIKKLIKFTRERIQELIEVRHKYDNLSLNGVANIAKNKYIIGMLVCDKYKKRLFNEFDFLDTPFPLLNRIIIEYNKQIVTTSEFRDIARSEPWRQYWTAKEGVSSIFPVPAIELTDEQLTLISWTRLYDNIFQHPKCPSDEVIEDDDALDGFLIKDRKEREKEKNGGILEELTDNQRIKNADEVFIPVDTQEDAVKINELNSEAARSIKRQREKYLAQKGQSSDRDLPDVRQRLQLEINQAGMAAAQARMHNGQ